MRDSIKLSILLLAVFAFTSCASTGDGCYDFGNAEKAEKKNINSQDNYKKSKVIFTAKKC